MMASLINLESVCVYSIGMPSVLKHTVACGILPDQGLNPCPLHWQVDSYPLQQTGKIWEVLDLFLLH